MNDTHDTTVGIGKKKGGRDVAEKTKCEEVHVWGGRKIEVRER